MRDMAQQSRQYAEVPHRDNTNLGPTTREVHGMERIPIFRPRQVTGGLRRPTKGFGRVEQPEEVFDEEFYDIFPWARGVDPFDESRTEWEPAEWYVENQIQLGNGLEPDPMQRYHRPSLSLTASLALNSMTCQQSSGREARGCKLAALSHVVVEDKDPV